MGQGLDVCLAEPAEAPTLEECLESEFVRCLVRQAGLVLLGKKPAAVFCFCPRAWRGPADERAARTLARRLLSVYAREAAAYGLRLAWLASREHGLMLMAWRPACVERVLAQDGVREFLASRGFAARDARGLMALLAGRLRAYHAGRASFPHEVGLVLGYPLEDVRGFIADGGRGARATGRWRAYGDPEAARRRFEELEGLERHCKRLYSEGVPVRELLRMGAAEAA